MGRTAGLQSGAVSDGKDGRTSERILAESAELLRILQSGDAYADDITGSVAGPNP